MTTMFAAIGRTQREPGGLLIEATLAGDAATGAALERAVGLSLAEMGRGEEIAGRLLSVASRGGKIVLHALVTGARATLLAAERVYKGLSLECQMFGDEIGEITLVDCPLNKSWERMPQKIAVLYKRGERQMSITTAIHKYYGSSPAATAAEVDAAWEGMTPRERALASIKATLARPSSGGRDFLDWYADRAFKGGGNPPRRGGQF